MKIINEKDYLEEYWTLDTGHGLRDAALGPQQAQNEEGISEELHQLSPGHTLDNDDDDDGADDDDYLQEADAFNNYLKGVKAHTSRWWWHSVLGPIYRTSGLKVLFF